MTETSLFDAVAPIDRFRALLMADPDLQQRLSGIFEPAAFADAVVGIAADRGVTVTADEVFAALKADPLGIWRFSGAPVTNITAPEGDWLPTAIVSAMGDLAVDWTHFAGRGLSESFFEDSLRRTRTLPINLFLRCRTPLQSLAGPGLASRAPTGFIFHQSRCGSTLAAQMLAADDRNVVISEAAPIDSIVQLVAARTDVPIEQRAELLRMIVGALGRDRLGGAGHYVVKLDSWHTLALPLFRHAFPETPWIFLYRDPVEILVSHARMAGAQTVPGAMPFDPYGIENAMDMQPDMYAALALGRTAEAVLDHWGLGGGLLVNYAELPEAMESRVLPHFGIEPDERARAALAMAARRDAKAPDRKFAGDSEDKQLEAKDELRALAERYMGDPYRRLEDLRRADQK